MSVSRETLFDRLRGLKLAGPVQAPAAVEHRSPGGLPGRLRSSADGSVHVADWSAPRDYAQGRAALDAHGIRRPLVAAAASRDPRFRDIDPSRWLFIDTETTSLNAGAGVWVFMVGMGWFEEDAFKVQQYLLPDPGSERALLAAVHRRMAAADAIVSFHGKSFDVPRLDDRFRLAGLDPAETHRPHLDLLHPCRRLFGHGLPDCRLRTIEERLLGFSRVDDLPGALCPEAYFAYLRGRPHRLADVFLHNRLDVLSLSALAGYVAGAYFGECDRSSPLRAGLDWAEAGDPVRAAAFLAMAPGEEARAPVSVTLAAARWLARLGREDAAVQLLEAARSRHLGDPRPTLALKRIERRQRHRVASPASEGASGRRDRARNVTNQA